MKILQFIITVAVWTMCSLPGYAAGGGTAMQAAGDSIVAPNVFTPNGDSFNEFFEVKSTNNQPVLLKIYTRAGVLVYSFEARLHAWNGRSLNGQEMSTGVYYYTAEVRGSSPKITKAGFVHLFR